MIPVTVTCRCGAKMETKASNDTEAQLHIRRFNNDHRKCREPNLFTEFFGAVAAQDSDDRKSE